MITAQWNHEHQMIRRQLTLSKLPSLRNSVWQTLEKDLHWGQYTYAAGSQYKLFGSKDAGWLWFHPRTKTPEGHTPGKFGHRY